MNGQLEIFEDQFREVPWKLSDRDPSLSEDEFALRESSKVVAEVDVSKEGKIEYRFVQDLHQQMTLLDLKGPQSESELAAWLDRMIKHHDIPQSDASLFFHKMIQWLQESRGFSLEQLVEMRFRLRDAAANKIGKHRQAALREAYQKCLIPGAESPLEVSPSLCFKFPANQYPANRLYPGPIGFRKHYYELPGDMNSEEASCASIIDTLENVKYWVRNLERDQYSFWLRTSTDNFYPDFVALLKDGRYLVVEYKGEHLLGNPDTKEKNAVGEIWETQSNGACLFRLATKTNMEALRTDHALIGGESKTKDTRIRPNA